MPFWVWRWWRIQPYISNTSCGLGKNNHISLFPKHFLCTQHCSNASAALYFLGQYFPTFFTSWYTEKIKASRWSCSCPNETAKELQLFQTLSNHPSGWGDLFSGTNVPRYLLEYLGWNIWGWNPQPNYRSLQCGLSLKSLTGTHELIINIL